MMNVVAEVPLPGEGGERLPLGHEPFPSRMHMFVWRNWTVVPQTRLAEVLKTTPENVAGVAASMGLAPQGAVLPEWRDKGYITVVRRNWHLLPYDQIMRLLGMTRERLRYCLAEDDFLFHKLGSLKPKCEPLVYQKPTADEAAAAARLAGLLKEEGLAELLRVPGEPRFAFVEKLTRPDPKLRAVKDSGDSPFDLRFIFSYFADYGDPLIDPEVKSYPEGLLQRLGAAGVNGVWVHTVLRTLAKDPAFPEFGEDCEKRIAGLRKLVARGKKYGVDIYLYMNEPRTMPSSFFKRAPERDAMRGVPFRDNVRLCTSHPEVRRWMSDALAAVFKQVPGLGGVFTITASENPTSCASHGKWKDCPHCKDRTDAEIIAEVNAVIAEGVHRSNKDAKVLAWDWGWRGHGDAQEIIELLPKDVWLMSVSEWALPIERGGVKSKVGEYSISSVGPGPRASRHWKLAKDAGLKTAAKVQVGATWEFCAIPYLPTMDLVAEHARNLASSGVDGVMLSWSLGCYPSPNLEVFQAFKRDTSEIGPVLDSVARRRYGAEAAPVARAAWTAFSDGFREYPYHISTVYVGPQHMGPANPLYLKPTGYAATMVGIPYDSLKQWRSIYPEEVWIGQMEKVRAGFERGCGIWEKLVRQTAGKPAGEIAAREMGLFHAATLHFASCVNQARFVSARDRAAAATDEADRKARVAELRGIARDELGVAKRFLPLVMADSRIGYESSNHYFYIPQDIIEKVLCCRHILAETATR
ncbi:MAG: hypothetical protein PHN85_10660 [Kiritimatiellae bacterium]|nr:hypothetical protein [Kiritimatiellia bacterium]